MYYNIQLQHFLQQKDKSHKETPDYLLKNYCTLLNLCYYGFIMGFIFTDKLFILVAIEFMLPPNNLITDW